MSSTDDNMKKPTEPNGSSDPKGSPSIPTPLHLENSISQRVKALFTGSSAQTTPDTLDELQLQRYLDGRLDASECAKVEVILKQNPATRRTLNALREEAELIHTALEPRIEASKRIADKVLLTLHHEERFRLNANRNRRLRRQVIGWSSVAALVTLCLWLVKPREALGTALSGTTATLVTSSGERHTLNKDSLFYDGDSIQTGLGQFLRLRLADGSLLDMDEHSRLELERGSDAALKLSVGRMGVDASSARRDVVLHLPCGTLKISAGTLLDVWLAKPSAAAWPSLFGSNPAGEIKADTLISAAPQSAVVLTVIRGSAYLTSEQSTENLTISTGQRSICTASTRTVQKVDMSASRVLESRGDNGWHSSTGSGPRDRTLIGLMAASEFIELAHRLKLDQKGLLALKDALTILDVALLEKNAMLRAQKLADGQQALRAAYEPLDPTDEFRRIGRMLEGQAHMQRGYALLESGSVEHKLAAHVAFTAASVAFDEAQQPIKILGQPLPSKVAKPSWHRTLCESGKPAVLWELSPIDQSWILASFHFALAELWRARTAESNAGTGLAVNAASEFLALCSDRDNPTLEPLGRSVEFFAALLGQALSLDLAGQRSKACDVLQDLISTPTVGMNSEARAQADGIRQAALLALTEMYVLAKELKKAQSTAEDFNLLYPLEQESAVAKKIKRLVAETR